MSHTDDDTNADDFFEKKDDFFQRSDDDSEEREGDAKALRKIREWEASGFMWSAISADGRMEYRVGPKPDNPDRGNVTSLGNAARERRRRQGK